MTLYKFSINGKGIYKETIDVVEKEKTFQKEMGISKQIFKKSDLDVVVFPYGNPEMISLKGNPEHFIREVIKYKKNKVSQLEKKIAAERNFIIRLNSEYANILVNRVQDDNYLATGFINFKYNNETIHGTPTTYVCDRLVPINNIMFGEDFLSLIQDENFNLNLKIKNIFINGSETNLGLEGFVFDKNACIINMEKFKEIVNRHKVELNVVEVEN